MFLFLCLNVKMADIIRLQAHIKENLTRKYLQNQNLFIFSPDWIIKPNKETNNKLVFVEVKQKFQRTTGIFIKGKPPINWSDGGHGFDLNQFENYMYIYNTFNIRTLLIIYDETNNTIYQQHLDVLAKVIHPEKHILKSKSTNKHIICWKLNNFENKGEFKK